MRDTMRLLLKKLNRELKRWFRTEPLQAKMRENSTYEMMFPITAKDIERFKLGWWVKPNASFLENMWRRDMMFKIKQDERRIREYRHMMWQRFGTYSRE